MRTNALLLTFLGLFCILKTTAQDTRYVGTWKYHDEWTHEEDNGEYSYEKRDYYIKIGIEDGAVYVRLKLIYNDRNAKYAEGENIRINEDGSISFDEYLNRRDYHENSHLFWTTWIHYVAKYEGGRLIVSEKTMAEGCNAQGCLVEDQRDIFPIKQKIYYNEKDNW